MPSTGCEDIFYDRLCNMEIFEKEDFEKNVTYSRWCTRERPIPKEILSFYDNAGFDSIQDTIQDDVIPNLINVPATMKLLLELVTDSVDVIGTEKADEFAGITDDAELITALIRYAVLNDHNTFIGIATNYLMDNTIEFKIQRGSIGKNCPHCPTKNYCYILLCIFNAFLVITPTIIANNQLRRAIIKCIISYIR